MIKTVVSCLIIAISAITLLANVQAQSEEITRIVDPVANKMDLNVTSATAFISESTGHLTIVGEILNTTPQEKAFPVIAATVYDQNDQVIGTGNTYADIYPIPAGGRSPFQITFSEDDISNLSEAKSFRIQASAN